MEKKFAVVTMYKKELAAAYGIKTETLRAWVEKNTKLWKELNYDESHLLTPKKVKAIIDHLGEPEIIN